MKDFYEKDEIPDHLLKYFEEVPYPKIPSIVLDPFAGSGTTLLVASKLGRRSVGYELSIEYCCLIVERNKQAVMRLE